MAKSSKRKTVPTYYSLDPDVANRMEEMAADLNVKKSTLVNYILDRVIRATSEADVIGDTQEAKEIKANNRSILYPGPAMETWSLVINLEFVQKLA
jgi:hypothetical protein